MDSRLLLFLYPFLVLFLHISQIQLLAFNSKIGNASIKCIERERQALLTLKQGFRYENDWLPSWGNGENQKECCNWECVQCSNETGHVLKLDLQPCLLSNLSNNGSAIISPSLGELHHLKYLDLSFIYSPQSIPDFIGSLTHLRYLSLSYCGFNGKIPPQLGNLLSLKYLNLSGNFLTGTIPHHFGNLSNLQHLGLNVFDSFPQTSLRSDLQWASHLSFLRHLSLPTVDLSSANNWQRLVSGLSHLQHLDLSYCKLNDSIPSSLSSAANFSTSLSFVDLHGNSLMYSSLIFPWLMNSTNSLSYLSLRHNNLKGTIPEAFGNMTSLQNMELDDNRFEGKIPVVCSLSKLDLSGNKLTGLLHEFVQSFSHCAHKLIQYLLLEGNEITGLVPNLSQLSSLQVLRLDNNRLNGTLNQGIGQISSLQELSLSNNSLRGLISVAHFSRLFNLRLLDLSHNEFTGSVPDLSQLSSLQVLRLDNNRFNGTLDQGIGQISSLQELSLSDNSLRGLISEAHFSRHFNLQLLDLSHNALVFNISTEWVPPFNLASINLASCFLGPQFPRWLQTQKSFNQLDISGAEIYDTVPNWFWNLASKVESLNLSHNHIKGEIENLPSVHPTYLSVVDLSSNSFQGAIPAFLSKAFFLDLSNNKFTIVNLLLCANKNSTLTLLDLSNNHLRGELPDCWTNIPSLGFLDMTNNHFYGNLPTSMGSLRQIRSLHLGNNNFSGEIPLSLNDCKELKIFEAAHNYLSGPLPSWIGAAFPRLLVLSLHSNRFYGSMPLSICHLVELRLLDLSFNSLSGYIPKCMNNLSAMAIQENSTATITHIYFEVYNNMTAFKIYDDSASLIWKGKMSKYKSTLGLLRSIDLSSNKLIGEIPSEIMDLVGLVSLNISRNMLNGEIPPTVGQLKSLDFLDLSRNHLSRRIPSQLSQIYGLSVLDLSYNDLSGEIPIGTQLQSRDASAYNGNPKLCGPPLNKTCPKIEIQGPQNDGNDEKNFTKGFYIAMAIGFIMGFWGVCCSLILMKSWRYAYFKFLSDAYDKLYVLVAIKMAKLKRFISCA